MDAPFACETATNRPPPTVLTIAGFDPSSGAGLTADLKVFAAHRLFGVACPTALTVQSTQGVRRSQPVEPGLITDTLDCLADDFKLAGVKIGMLAGASAVLAVARWLQTYQNRMVSFPVVLDPVLRSSSGAVLLTTDGLDALRTELLPLITVLTPNLPEAAVLTGSPVRSRLEVETAARSLRALGVPAVIVTGGHLQEDGASVDDLLLETDSQGEWLSGPRVHTRGTHGTGCAFSSALLAQLVLGLPLSAAFKAAKFYVRQAMEHAYPVGGGQGPLHHLFAVPSWNQPEAGDGTGPEPSE